MMLRTDVLLGCCVGLLAAAGACSTPEVRSPASAAALPSLPAVVGTIDDRELDELSGIAVSRRNPGILWAHNDSGDSARLFAFDETGKSRAHVTIKGAGAGDWEDIAIGQGPEGRTTLFIGDIGDNLAIRPWITVYRVTEPVLGASNALEAEAEPLDFTFPDKRHNCEALVRDPQSNRLVFITADSPPGLYVGDALAPAKSKQVLQHVGGVQVGEKARRQADAYISAAHASTDGTLIAAVFGAEVVEWMRERGEPIEAALARDPVRSVYIGSSGVEAIAYGPDASLFYAPEGVRPALRRIEPLNASAFGR